MAHFGSGQQLGHGDGQNLKSCPLWRPGWRNPLGRLQTLQRAAEDGRTFVVAWAVVISSSCLLNTTSRKVPELLRWTKLDQSPVGAPGGSGVPQNEAHAFVSDKLHLISSKNFTAT